MDQNSSTKAPKKKLSGSARRLRAKYLNTNSEQKQAVVKPTKREPVDDKNLRGVSKNSRSILKVTRNDSGPISNKALEMVRQKLVSSLMQILPQTATNAPNWNNGPNQGGNWNNGPNQGGNWNNGPNQGGNWNNGPNQGANWNNGPNQGPNWNNGPNQGPNWNNGPNQAANWNNGPNQGALVPFKGNGNNNKNNNNNRMPNNWNFNNNTNGMPSPWNTNGGNNPNQGFLVNDNNRVRANNSTAWVNNNLNQAPSSNSQRDWNNSNNRNHSAPQNGAQGWVAQCPEPPAWGKGNPPEKPNSRSFDSVLASDPRNAGGREFFQGELEAGRNTTGRDMSDLRDMSNGRDMDGSHNDSFQSDNADINNADNPDLMRFVVLDLNMPNGRITQKSRQDIFTNAFNKELANAILEADSRFPPIQIKSARFDGDVYKIVTSKRCVDVLQNLIDGLPELWPGSKLRLVAKPNRTKLTRVTLFLHAGAIGRSNEEILLILKRQNAAMNTDVWDVYFRKESERTVLMILGIDSQSIDYLGTTGGRAYFLTSTGLFTLGKLRKDRSRKGNNDTKGVKDEIRTPRKPNRT